MEGSARTGDDIYTIYNSNANNLYLEYLLCFGHLPMISNTLPFYCHFTDRGYKACLRLQSGLIGRARTQTQTAGSHKPYYFGVDLVPLSKNH